MLMPKAEKKKMATLHTKSAFWTFNAGHLSGVMAVLFAVALGWREIGVNDAKHEMKGIELERRMSAVEKGRDRSDTVISGKLEDIQKRVAQLEDIQRRLGRIESLLDARR